MFFYFLIYGVYLREKLRVGHPRRKPNWRSNPLQSLARSSQKDLHYYPSRGSISTFNIHNSTFPTHPNKSVLSAFQKQTLYKISILNTLICLTWFKKKVLTKTLEATLSLYFNFSNPCHLRSKNDCYSK